jgi:hypothetical protein
MPRQNEPHRVTVDYYELLSGRSDSLTAEEWQAIMKAVSAQFADPNKREVAVETTADVLFDMSNKWMGIRIRITRKARDRSDSPGRRSEYCLYAIKGEVTEAIRRFEEEDTPDLENVRRQVLDHLRSLRNRKILVSFKLRTRQGRDLRVMWALDIWEPGAKDRKPPLHLDEVRELLPVILARGDENDAFNYAEVLPNYLPMILKRYEAALSSSEITFTVVAKISPPLAALYRSEDFESLLAVSWTGPPTPHDIIEGKRAWDSFFGGLSERERKVLEMKEQDKPIDQIAQAIGCSPRTVNNLWNGIQEKAAAYLDEIGG